MDLNLTDKVALVTGASAGLGLAAAKALAQEGAVVGINSRSQENLGKAAEKIKAETGREVFPVVGDLTAPGMSEKVVDEVVQKHGRIDILISNAGGPPAGMFLDLDKDDWRKAVDLTLFPAIDLARAVLPGMKERGWGRVIFITSLAVKQPADNLIISNTYRAGVTGFAKSIANQFSQFGITVNTVCPGYTDTERLKELAGKISASSGITVEQVYENWRAGIPAGRIGKPHELAALITFLASDKAAYITGSTIAVDGGTIKSLL